MKTCHRRRTVAISDSLHPVLKRIEQEKIHNKSRDFRYDLHPDVLETFNKLTTESLPAFHAEANISIALMHMETDNNLEEHDELERQACHREEELNDNGVVPLQMQC